MKIEEFNENQAIELSSLIKRNLIEINSQDYPKEVINYLIECYSAENLRINSKTQYIIVAIKNEEIIGTGGLANFGNKEEPNYYGVAMFIKPEVHKNGIGKIILHLLEGKAKTLDAKKITVRAAKGSEGFYKKLGYQYKNQKAVSDNTDSKEMEKEL